jgi:hypothetical protein
MSYDHNAVRTEAVSCLSVAKISFQLWGSFLCTRKSTKLPSDMSPARIQPVYLGETECLLRGTFSMYTHMILNSYLFPNTKAKYKTRHF